MDESLERAIQRAGGQTALAAELELKPQAVQQWSRVPAERVLDVARATKFEVTPHELRPDLYPDPMDGVPRRSNGKKRGSS